MLIVSANIPGKRFIRIYEYKNLLHIFQIKNCENIIKFAIINR